MSDHSPEAIAAYPAPLGLAENSTTYRLRTAFDKGRAVNLAATREALGKLIMERRWGATITDERWRALIENRGESTTLALGMADAILAAGILRDEREVQAEALEQAADAQYRHGASSGHMLPTIRGLLTNRAAEIRAGRA